MWAVSGWNSKKWIKVWDCGWAGVKEKCWISMSVNILVGWLGSVWSNRTAGCWKVGSQWLPWRFPSSEEGQEVFSALCTCRNDNKGSEGSVQRSGKGYQRSNLNLTLLGPPWLFFWSSQTCLQYSHRHRQHKPQCCKKKWRSIRKLHLQNKFNIQSLSLLDKENCKRCD